MVTLKRIISAHLNSTSPRSIADNLGDGYLLSGNRVYRNIRAAAGKAGFRFSNRKFHHYATHSLSQLPWILKDRVLPYSDNVAVLAEFSPIPGLSWREIPEPAKNYLLHESSHGVARRITDSFLPRRKDWSPLERERREAFKILIEESFANTCERLAYIDAKTDLDRIFLQQNSYMGPCTSEEMRILRQEGIGRSFPFLFFSFLYANFLYEEWPAAEYGRVLKWVGRKRSVLSLKLFRMGDLNPGFRLNSANFYFKLVGLKTSIFRLLDFDFMGILEREPAYRECIEALAAAVQTGVC